MRVCVWESKGLECVSGVWREEVQEEGEPGGVVTRSEREPGERDEYWTNNDREPHLSAVPSDASLVLLSDLSGGMREGRL